MTKANAAMPNLAQSSGVVPNPVLTQHLTSTKSLTTSRGSEAPVGAFALTKGYGKRATFFISNNESKQQWIQLWKDRGGFYVIWDVKNRAALQEVDFIFTTHLNPLKHAEWIAGLSSNNVYHVQWLVDPSPQWKMYGAVSVPPPPPLFSTLSQKSGDFQRESANADLSKESTTLSQKSGVGAEHTQQESASTTLMLGTKVAVTPMTCSFSQTVPCTFSTQHPRDFEAHLEAHCSDLYVF